MRLFLGNFRQIVIEKLRRGHIHTCWQRCRRPFCLKNVNPETCPNGCLPLTMVAPGKPVTLVKIAGERRLRHRLTELGLIPGVELKVMKDGGGPLLLAIQDTRLALGRGMAHKIIVQVA